MGDQLAAARAAAPYKEPKQPHNSVRTSRDQWYADAGRTALGRAEELSNREYTPYTGSRVATLSGNEQMAGELAGSMSSRFQPFMDRLSGGYSAGALKQFEDPYLDSVLNSRIGNIESAYTREASALNRNAAATDAFRSGRTDRDRARLRASKLKTIDEATNEAKSAAFQNAQNAYFSQGQQDIGALGATRAGLDSQIGALSSTGATERAVRQAQADFNYGQFLEGRDWDVNNLNNLLTAIQAVDSTAGKTEVKKGEKKSSGWGAVLGLAGTAIGTVFGGPVGGKIGGALGGMVGDAI